MHGRGVVDASIKGNWNKPAFFFFCSFHFSQKRAKKIEDDSIYIRHSQLMLEVGIPSGDVGLQLHFLALWRTGCCLTSRLHAAWFTLFSSALTSGCRVHEKRVFVCGNRLWSDWFRRVLLSLEQQEQKNGPGSIWTCSGCCTPDNPQTVHSDSPCGVGEAPRSKNSEAFLNCFF